MDKEISNLCEVCGKVLLPHEDCICEDCYFHDDVFNDQILDEEWDN